MASGALHDYALSMGTTRANCFDEEENPFQVHRSGLRQQTKELLEPNRIHQTVPTITYNGKPVCGSLVILEYLEEAFPEQVLLMPKDAYERSKYRFWVDYIYKAHVTWNRTWNRSFLTKSVTPEKQAANETVVKTLQTLDEALTTFSPDGPFFAGTKFGLLDAVLAPLRNALVVLQELNGIVVLGPEQLPRLHRWLEAIKGQPSVSSTLPPAAELLAHWQGKQRSLA